MELHDAIKFNVNGKIRKIELHLGDIVKLKSKHKVDILLVSAFPRALHDELNLSVHDLATKKGEDLRSDFNCWISKDLPSKSPFKRILCFEQDYKKIRQYSYFDSQVSVVGDVFRALFTCFSSNDWSMMTPILASGNQGVNKVMMIREMIKACAAWIHAGMPLLVMKIVVFKANLASKTAIDDQNVLEEFAVLKNDMNFTPTPHSQVPVNTDVFMIYVKNAENKIVIFSEQLKLLFDKKTLRMKFFCIASENDEMGNDVEVYESYEEMMLQSKKVAIFLSKDFLQNRRAVEIYNLLLCLSIKLQTKLLISICFDKIDNIPTYMTMDQWIDCRIKIDTVKAEQYLMEGAAKLHEILYKTLNLQNTNVEMGDEFESDYDIFLSYSHKDCEFVNILHDFLKKQLPDKKIFFDKNEINIGTAWQNKLFMALNNTRLFIAVLSDNYICSQVCQEEFCIALSQHRSPMYSTEVLSVWIQRREELSQQQQQQHIQNYFGVLDVVLPQCSAELLSDEESLRETTCHFLYHRYILPLLGREKTDPEPFVKDIQSSGEMARKDFFTPSGKRKKGYFEFMDIAISESPFLEKQRSLKYDVVIVYASVDQELAIYLKATILCINKCLEVLLSPVKFETQSNVFEVLDSCYLIVVLLNPYFVTSQSCMLHLQIAISVHRKNNAKLGTCICPIVLESLPAKPSFIHLIPNRFKADDDIYRLVIKAYRTQYSGPGNMLKITNSKVSYRFQHFFHFVATWIGLEVFRNQSVTLKPSPVIYSSYDLSRTNFEDPAQMNKLEFLNKMKPMKIKKQDVDECCKCSKNRAEVKESGDRLKRLNSNDNPALKTSSCSCM